LLSSPYLRRGRIETERTDRDDHRSFRRIATSEGAEPSQQLTEGERLSEIVIGACVESANPIIDRPARGNHDDRRPVARAAKVTTGRETVLIGEHDVEHHDVVCRVREHRARVTGCACHVTDHVDGAQRPSDCGRHGYVVLDDQHAHTRKVRSLT